MTYARADNRSTVLDALMTRLRVLEQDGLLEVRIDTVLSTGGPVHEDIAGWIAEGDVAIALISNHFLSSDYVRKVEMPALEARKTQRSDYLIMPFILERCPWQNHDIFKNATCCPNEERPFGDLPPADRDKWLEKAMNDLRQHLQRLPPKAAPLARSAYSPRTDRPIFGREPERAFAIESLKRTPVLLLHGAAGQGKTELARYTAAAIEADYPDGVVEIEVENESQAHNLPPLLAEKLGLPSEKDVFEVLARSKAIILVDGFERLMEGKPHDEPELFLRPFIEALRRGGSRAIITSQIQFERREGMKSRPVEPLDRDAALALFHEASGGLYREEPQEEIGRFLTSDLSGHPYSIIILGRYSVGLGLSFAALQREWGVTWTRVGEFRPYIGEEGLATAFELTYGSLPPDAKALLVGMGGIPDGLTRAEIDSVWDFAADHLNESLRTLGQRGLLDERARAHQAFRLLGPIYRFAGHKLGRLATSDADKVKPYLAALDGFYDVFVPEHAPQESDEDPTEKNKLIRRHYHNIHVSLERRLIVAVDAAAVAAGELVLLMYWAYHNNMVGARDAISASNDAINYLLKARDVFEVNGRPAEKVSCLHYMGLILWLRGDVPQAERYFAEALASDHCTPAMRLDHARVSSHIEYREGSLVKSAKDYLDAIVVAQNAKDLRGEISGEIGLIDNYRKLHDFKAAKAAFKRIEAKLPDVALGVRGSAVRALAYVTFMTGDLVKAQSLYEEAVGYLAIVSQFGEAHCRRGLGDIHAAAGRIEAAETEFEKALELYDIARKPRSLGVCLVWIGRGRMALRQEDPDTALAHLDVAAKLLVELNEPYELAVTRELQGEAFARKGQLSQALGQFDIAATQFNKVEAVKPRDRVVQRIAELNARRGTA